MSVIQHNLSAINGNRQYGIVNNRLAKTSEKLASGYKINRAADDAAGLSISEKMRKMIRGLDRGAQNTMDGISFLQVGDGAMHEVHAMLQRMTELAVQAANGTNSDSDRLALDEEMQAIKKEINRIGDTTVFNEMKVFDNDTVTFRVEDKPNDLEIFNATYSDTGVLKTYGGFVFHGERVPWSDIDADMVKVDANGKEVFVKGEYEYKSPNTSYEFKFYCEDGDELPLITRVISIEADDNGIVLGGERFGWDKVYDVNGNCVSANNLHAGPWTVDYYGAKLIFTVSEPVEYISQLASDVNECKSTTVVYSWEGKYGIGTSLEEAVDIKKTDILDDVGAYNRVSQDNVDNMYSSATGIRFTVKADDDGIWLVNDAGTELNGSRKEWADLGILSWNDEMDTPGYINGQPVINYVYSDRTSDLEISFKLSDITNKEGVIKGLDGVQIYQRPMDTNYHATAQISSGNITAVTFRDDTVVLDFEEEYALNRAFDTKNWVMANFTATYDEAANKITYSYDGGKYVLSGTLSNLENQTKSAVQDYIDWVEAEKTTALLNNQNSSNITADVYALTGKSNKTISTTLSTDEGERLIVDYKYDYKNQLSGLEDKVDVQLVQVNTTSLSNDLYVLKDGKYISTNEYYSLEVEANRLYVATYTQEALKNLEEDVKNDPLLLDQYDTLRQAIIDNEMVYWENENNTSKARILALDAYKIETTYDGDPIGYSALLLNATDEMKPKVGEELANGTKLDLTSENFSLMEDLRVDEKSSLVNRPLYNSYIKETPLEPELWIVHSSEANDRTGISRFAMSTTALGLSFTDVRTADSATKAIKSVEDAIAYVSQKRSYFGAIQNRLEHTLNNIKNVSENTQAAESRIRDANMAKEMVKYSRDNILLQAGQSILVQANQQQQGILQILQ